jgi:hypothetical protein
MCVLALGACAQLDPLPAEQCGNGVVDSNEDCDGFPLPEHLADGLDLRCGGVSESDGRKRCRYVCDPMAPSGTCPAGWSCGQSGICLYPVGEYRAEPPIEAGFDDWAVRDMNGDGHPDIVGITATGISIKTGTPSGELSAARVTPTPPRNSAPSFGKLDDDDPIDVLTAIDDGLFVLRGGKGGDLTPVPYAALDPATVYPDSQFPGGLFPVVTQMNSTGQYTPYDHFLVVADTSTMLQLSYVPNSFESLNPAINLPSYQPLSKLRKPVTVANIDATPGRMEEEFALAFEGAGDVWVFGQNISVMAPALELRSTVSLSGVTVEQGARFADVDGDGFQDLMVSVTGDEVAVALGMGNGSFAAPTIDSDFDALLAIHDPAGQLDDLDTVFSRWPLASADFDGDGKADHVTPQGVYVTGAGSGLTQTAWRTAEDPWTQVVVGDFNGDGNLDIVGHFDPDELKGKLELLIGDGTGVFVTHPLAINGVPQYMVAGDFDGDLVTDIAVGTIDSREQDEDQVFVLFGTRDGVPAEAVPMGRFGYIEEIQGGAFWSPLQPVPDRTNDLLVVINDEPDFSGKRRVALLNGSPARQLAAPFTLISTTLGGAFSPELAVAGHFTGQADAADVLILSTDGIASDEIWFLEGRPGARFADQPIKLSLGTSFGNADCSAEDALWVKGDIDGDGATDLIGLSNSSECDLSGFGLSSQPELLQLSVDDGPSIAADGPTAIPGGYLVPYDAVLRDVDLDGFADLVVTYSGEYLSAFDSLATGSGTVIYWNDNGSISLDNASAVPIPDSVIHVIAAAPLQADDDEALELAVFTDEGVLICHLDGRTFGDTCDQHTVGEGFFRSELGGERLQVADINNDGLDDVIIGDGAQIFIGLAQSQLDAQGSGGAQ